ncbi:hypothetical protein PYCCODRAFT_1479005 [Trametes coccinea BRFM310]|uniref:F-box domain-containing protein n=1 Tax=Trametes coccinea (strain BRFM310) TaxID=1353009 RepID=A0A1Y2II40_TRAC3|nr:hypothetical protein PYCCODRAFT_1479005 [Trametes coccinea BRFM310]
MRASPANLSHDTHFPAPHLKFDILIELLHHVPQQSDASALTRTCKTLYEQGTKVLLRRGVTVENGAQILSFCDFLLRNPNSRLPYLRKLHLKLRLMEGVEEDESVDDEEDLPAHVCNVLAKTLRMMSSLEDLTIESCEELFERKPAIQQAIMALKGLRRLQIASVGVLAGELLEGMQSSLVELDVHCYSEELYEPTPVMSLLTRNQLNVEKLSAWYVEVGTSALQFPRVRALALRSLYAFDIENLHKTFPGLQYLELTAPEPAVVEDAIADHGRLGHSSRWKSLRYLCGSVDALYALGPVSRVAKVEVDCICSTGECLSRLRAVVSDAQPTCLVLHTGFYGHGVLDLSELAELLPPEGVPSMTHLMLDLAVDKLTGTKGDLMAGLTSLLKRSPIEFCILRIAEICDCEGEATKPPLEAVAAADGGDGRHGQSEEDDANADNDTDADGESEDGDQGREHGGQESAHFSIRNSDGYHIAQTLPLAQHQQLVRELAGAGNSLTHVVVKIHRQGDTHWAIERSDKGLKLKKLEATIGAALVRAHDLGPNDRSSGLEGIP